MSPTTSRDLPKQPPREDRARDDEKAVVKDADTTDQTDRDTIHGDGGEIGIETQ